jgi:hypothetical protein
MNPRHNTGRVRIGWAYVPKAMRIEGDAIRIQAALLEPRSATPQTLFQRVAGSIWRLL